MAEWNVDKLKEELAPLGFFCQEHAWVGDKKPTSWLFKLPKSVLLEFFIVLDMNTGEIGCGDTFMGHGRYVTCNIKDVNFDIMDFARNYVRTYKVYQFNEMKKGLEEDFKNG